MDGEKYTKSVVLLCPTCGNSNFEMNESSESQQEILCPSCDRTMGKDELIRENGEVIDSAVDQMKTEIVKDVQKELQTALRNAFKGSISFRIK